MDMPDNKLSEKRKPKDSVAKSPNNKMDLMIKLVIFATILSVGAYNRYVKSHEEYHEEYKNKTYSNGEERVAVPESDPEMSSAIEKACDTLPNFMMAFRSPKKSQGCFMIKARFTEGAEIEYLWVTDLIEDGESFHGVLVDKPVSIKRLEDKREVTITKDQISDWMYVDGKKVIGAYTMRVLVKHMNPKEREEFKKEYPVSFE
jgi:uncharacterized protein YegJ (DUF2314 family)